MQTLFKPNIPNLPPTHGLLLLGCRLALSTTLIISLVMGIISVSQQMVDVSASS